MPRTSPSSAMRRATARASCSGSSANWNRNDGGNAPSGSAELSASVGTGRPDGCALTTASTSSLSSGPTTTLRRRRSRAGKPPRRPRTCRRRRPACACRRTPRRTRLPRNRRARPRLQTPACPKRQQQRDRRIGAHRHGQHRAAGTRQERRARVVRVLQEPVAHAERRLRCRRARARDDARQLEPAALALRRAGRSGHGCGRMQHELVEQPPIVRRA